MLDSVRPRSKTWRHRVSQEWLDGVPMEQDAAAGDDVDGVADRAGPVLVQGVLDGHVEPGGAALVGPHVEQDAQQRVGRAVGADRGDDAAAFGDQGPVQPGVARRQVAGQGGGVGDAVDGEADLGVGVDRQDVAGHGRGLVQRVGPLGRDRRR